MSGDASIHTGNWLEGIRLMKTNFLGIASPVQFEMLWNKVILLYFTASWCSACAKFMDKLKEFSGQINFDQLEIVMICVDSDEVVARNYLSKKHRKWAWLEADHEKVKQLMATYDVICIPVVVLVDRNGKVLRKNIRAQIASSIGKRAKVIVSEWVKQLHSSDSATGKND
ncbi:hypothetical protein D918_00661 [Trichuris suis]|nr:hypothetical protein D918_00661 [Trichuris suis]